MNPTVATSFDGLPCPAWCEVAEHQVVRHGSILIRRHEGHVSLSDVVAVVVGEDYVALLIPGAPPQRHVWVELSTCALDSSDLLRLADAVHAGELVQATR
jgi:hypothetical protein